MADATTTKASGGLTPREGEVALAALQCVKGGEIQIDYAALCDRLGFKNEATARTAWCGVRRKLFTDTKLSTDEPGTPKAKTPRKAKDSNGATPKPAKGAPKAGAGAAADKDGDHDNGDDEKSGSAAAVADGDANRSEGQSQENSQHIHVQATFSTHLIAFITASHTNVLAPLEAPTTPKTPTTPKKRSRKTKAEKEAEAAANGEAAPGDGDEDEKPPKKRRTPAKKKVTESENNGEMDGDTKATPAKGKKASTPRKSATAAAHKVTDAASPGEEEIAVVEVATVIKEKDGVSDEPDASRTAVSTGASASKGMNADVNGSVGDIASAAVESVAAKAAEVLAGAAGDN
ncbi:hypothetical protein AYO20_02082 [Fonsecaea nubica]|uniref:Uncharacterized protein n=1 Tax=Fonsecaea nubica TaxID=856822 RepID=A0A178DB20_9EURO|nr:hypothetical protein AYO20_02082 [Fonsecaea nubica]OAL38433.1 hypothetical protein AYO20_02082 [Fonsecaea nubica]